MQDFEKLVENFIDMESSFLAPGVAELIIPEEAESVFVGIWRKGRT